MQIVDSEVNGMYLIRSNVGQTFSKLQRMPGRNKWVGRELLFKPTGANIAFLLEHFPDATWDGDGARQSMESYISLKMAEQNQIADKQDFTIAADMSADGYDYKTKPLIHQRKSFLMAREKSVWGHFHEQGTGKTKVAIDTASFRYLNGDIDTLLVIAPNGVHINWILNEIPKHMPDFPKWMNWYSSGHSNRKLTEIWDAATKVRGKQLRIVAFNVEAFQYPKSDAVLLFNHWLASSKKVMVVVDESSRIGNFKSIRTKCLLKIADDVELKRIMSGTPITRGVENLYSQFNFLDKRIIGHETWTSFTNEFVIRGQWKNIIGYRNQEKLQRIIDAWSDRVLKEDCLDLPAKIYKRLPFEMSPLQRKLYDAYRKDCHVEVLELLKREGEAKAAEIAVVKALRLHQIACGWTPEKNPARLDGPNPRMATVMEDIEDAQEAGKKCIVWARFSGDLQDIAKKLGKKAVMYVGATKDNDRIRAVNDFQNNDKVTAFVGHVRAAGIGLTLTAATRVIYHSNTSDLELRLQSEDRAHRIGTVEHVTYSDVEAIRSIDRRIIDNLRAKKKMSEEILKDPTSIFMEE